MPNVRVTVQVDIKTWHIFQDCCQIMSARPLVKIVDLMNDFNQEVMEAVNAQKEKENPLERYMTKSRKPRTSG